jgi:hypothetical protein
VRAVVKRMHERPALWDYGQTTIQELGALYECCHLWIGNDGGPKHVATAAGCPTIVIIDSGSARVWTERREDTAQVAVHAAPTIQSQSSLAAAVGVEQVYAVANHYLSRAKGGVGDRPTHFESEATPSVHGGRLTRAERAIEMANSVALDGQRLGSEK